MELARRSIGTNDAAMRAALVTADLPISDLEASNGSFFRFEENGVLVGFAGYEEHDGSALLRSVVVVPSARGTGSGRAIVEALLRAMRDNGIERTYLLTTTAEDFFRHLGFAEIARQEAPAAILATPQAMTICRTAALLSRAT